MIISDSSRLLFVHIQKTGGSAIDQVLTAALPDVRRLPAADRHATLGKILDLEPALAGYWTVGFVRNPWERLLSWHRMMTRFQAGADNGNENAIAYLQKNTFAATVIDQFSDFEHFVMVGTEKFHRLRVPQVRYLTTRTRRADFIGRQESLADDMRAVLARLGLPEQRVRRVNVDRQRPDYREAYSEPMRRQVETLFARDIDAFHYSF